MSAKKLFRQFTWMRWLIAIVMTIVIVMGLTWYLVPTVSVTSTDQIVSNRRIIATTLRLTGITTSLFSFAGIVVLLVSLVTVRLRRRVFAPHQKLQSDQSNQFLGGSLRPAFRTVIVRMWFLMLLLYFALESMGVVLYIKAHNQRQTPSLDIQLQPKSENEFLIWAVGGSSMLGWPYSSPTNIPAIVGNKLKNLFPKLNVEVKNFAFGGATLQDMLPWIRVQKIRPDVLLIYSGHNEMNHRFNVNRKVDYQSKSSFAFTFPSFFVYQMSQELQKTTKPSYKNRQLIDYPLCTQQELDRIYGYFEEDLNELLKFCQREKILAICIIPSSNESGLGPNRSVLPDDFSMSKKKQLRDIYDQLSSRQLDIHERISLLEEARELAPTFAETWFRLGRIYHALGKVNDSIPCYQRAKDLDGCVIRATSRISEIYQTVADKYDCVLLDGSQILRPLSDDGILGDHIFHDEVHLNLRSQVAIGNAVINALQDYGVPNHNWENLTEKLTLDEGIDHFQIDDQTWYTAYSRAANQWLYLTGLRFDPIVRNHKSTTYYEVCKKIKFGNYRMRNGMPEVRFKGTDFEYLKNK